MSLFIDKGVLQEYVAKGYSPHTIADKLAFKGIIVSTADVRRALKEHSITPVSNHINTNVRDKVAGVKSKSRMLNGAYETGHVTSNYIEAEWTDFN